MDDDPYEEATRTQALMMQIFWLMLVLFLIKLPVTASAQTGAAHDDSHTVGSHRGVRVLFLEPDRMFFAADGGKALVAVSLKSGKRVWKLAGFDVPLAIVEGKLLARERRPNGFRAVLVDPKRGTVLRRYPVVVEQNLADLHENLGDTKRVIAHVRKDHAYIEWAWSHQAVSGVRTLEPPPVTGTSGIQKIALDSKAAESVKEIPVEEAPSSDPKPTVIPPGERAFWRQCGAGWCKFNYDQKSVRLSVERLDDSGKRTGPLVIEQIYRSVVDDWTGGHLLVFQKLEPDELARWVVFDLASLSKVGELATSRPMIERFVVMGDRLVTIPDITIFNLSSGKEIVRHSVATFDYDGPLPP